ncbi:PRAME family member 22 [Frankliniella fusca]|uniref:PRAME family member 22 n=1 Tax=Frankliniella fusca TaxID=407009 RepID=A0AAE1LDE8_9NEOP|nr:PRAME family member 22 [Frankliniella fusca]
MTVKTGVSDPRKSFPKEVQWIRKIIHLSAKSHQNPIENLLLVIDDCMDQLANPEILNFFIKGAHHRNLSVFFLSQCLFPKGLRQISLNCSVCVIFKNSRDLAQIRSFCTQVNPSDWRALLEAYQDATVAQHSYLLFDFSYKQSDHMRLRACIFPAENTVVYIPKKQYKSGVTRELPLVADRHGHE